MTRRRFRNAGAGALCLMVLALWADGESWALGGGKGYVAGAFWGADLDRDEFLSEQEARADTARGLHRVFHRVDRDADGFREASS